MTGVDSFSTTPLNNETVDGTTTWKEGQLPSTVNNGLRRLLSDLRERFNDLPWFQYGNGDQDPATHLAKPCIYVSGTSFSSTGNGNQTAYYHAGRPIRGVGSSTGTIYGYISSSSYNAGTDTTTVVVLWLSGSLANETLVISAGLPALGQFGNFRIIEFVVSDPNGAALTTGESKDYSRITAMMNGWRLGLISASLKTASGSGAVTIQLRNSTQAYDILSTALTIDQSETDTATAATPAVINVSNATVLTADQINVDVDGAGAGAYGLNVQAVYFPPAS